MPYTMKTEGLAELSEMLSQLGEEAPGIAAGSLYEGAGMMADALNAGAETIKTEPFHYVAVPGAVMRLPSPEEKAIVVEAAAGIAKFNKNGTEVDTSVGFRNAGYATLNGKTVPIPKIVNAINSGTSFMKKQPFVRKSASKATPKVLAKMKQYIEEAFVAIGKTYVPSKK